MKANANETNIAIKRVLTSLSANEQDTTFILYSKSNDNGRPVELKRIIAEVVLDH